MLYEVEQKFPCRDLTTVALKLERSAEWNVTWSDKREQADVYYAHPCRNFAETDEALRIRRVGSESRITYKGPKLDQETKTRREIELPIADDAERAAEFHALLIELGFRPVAEVVKRRRSAHLSYSDHAVEVSLDEVRDVGCFVEVEVQADQAGLDDARRVVSELAEQLGLSHPERRSYLELLLDKRVETAAVRESSE
ncbi:MAG: class IV adenylate cyclase [Planctomycetales bacterium]|nr:class IV adenylate cyclase [Planctomycetales bacterium]